MGLVEEMVEEGVVTVTPVRAKALEALDRLSEQVARLEARVDAIEAQMVMGEAYVTSTLDDVRDIISDVASLLPVGGPRPAS